MSHIPERKEKDCLNCGTIVQGKYCQNCGQENVVPKETFWHMVTHFFYDITHFDSSFFHTTKALIFKPGHLTTEYMRGKRATYLHPIRLYVFSSAMFFLLFFSLFKPDVIEINMGDNMTRKERQNFIDSLQVKMKKDTVKANQAENQRLLALASDTTKPLRRAVLDADNESDYLYLYSDYDYKSHGEYDSMQASLPADERDGWFARRMTSKQIEINRKYRENPEEVMKKFASSVLHRLPYMLFVSLPLFALILQLIYIRRRKQFYYADHGVFTIHLYVFTFILLTVVFLLDELERLTGRGSLTFLKVILSLGLFSYLLVAMKRFYKQGWLKTVIKFLLVSLLSFIMMLILFIFFMFFSAYTF